jgi:hypothetical protein
VKKGPLGLFDVYVEEGVLYSNRREGGRLPTNEEIIERLRKHEERRAGRDPGREPSGDAIAEGGCT